MANQTSKQRLTKAERKEEARRQRVELQRKMARGRRNRRIAMALVVVLVAAVAGYLVLRPKPAEADPQELLAAAPQATKAAGEYRSPKSSRQHRQPMSLIAVKRRLRSMSFIAPTRYRHRTSE